MTERPNLQCRSKQLVLQYLCTPPDETLEQTLSNTTLDVSTSHYNEALFMDPSCVFMRYMLLSKSNLFATRSFLQRMIFTICPNKCYLKPFNCRKFLLDTQTAIDILRVVKPVNYEIYIGNDDVGFARFDEFYPYIGGATKLHLQSSNISRNNVFENMVKTMAGQLRQLECPLTTNIYLSFIPSRPTLNLDEYILHSITPDDQIRLDTIFKHNVRRLKLVGFNANNLPNIDDIDDEYVGLRTLEELVMEPISKNKSIKTLTVAAQLSVRMPEMKTIQLTTSEVYKPDHAGMGFVTWLLQFYEQLQDFKLNVGEWITRVTVNIGIIKVLLNDEEQVSTSIEALKETSEFEHAEFNESASIGDTFAKLKLIDRGIVFDFQMVCMSRLSGSFLTDPNGVEDDQPFGDQPFNVINFNDDSDDDDLDFNLNIGNNDIEVIYISDDEN